jgi:glycine cleavage system H lipoate-binding protein
MFPGIYEFSWDAGHVIFLGIFYTVLVVVFGTVGIAGIRALRDLRHRRVEAVRWHADFEDLPASARRCRHELSGEIDERTCSRGFHCGSCPDHARHGEHSMDGAPVEPLFAGGLPIPADRLYHRGHTWVREEPDGTYTVGLDPLGSRLMGAADEVILPAEGERLSANGTAWRARKKGVLARILSPIDGEVAERGGVGDDWVLKLRAPEGGADTRHLLTPHEAARWMMRELERMQRALAPQGVGATLADGGVPVDDLSAVLPPDELDMLCGEVFLEP